MYLIIHETSLPSLLNILKADVLLKSSKIQELGLSTAQGSPKRRLSTDPKVSLRDSDFGDKFDEVDGVYFRLLNVSTPIKTNYGGDCVLIFSKDILDHNNFIINTEENFGFCIADDGVVAEAQFSGEEGMTISDLKNLNFLKEYNFNPYSSEILILGSVNLNDLQCIFVKQQLINEKLIEECNHKRIQLYALDNC
jgi:hypothetical protein